MDLLGDMPNSPETFYEAFQFYRAQGRMKEWNEALILYIKISHRPLKHGIRKYALKRMGHFAKQELQESRGRMYIPEL